MGAFRGVVGFKSGQGNPVWTELFWQVVAVSLGSLGLQCYGSLRAFLWTESRPCSNHVSGFLKDFDFEEDTKWEDLGSTKGKWMVEEWLKIIGSHFWKGVHVQVCPRSFSPQPNPSYRVKIILFEPCVWASNYTINALILSIQPYILISLLPLSVVENIRIKHASPKCKHAFETEMEW